jgi:hypothetical protein
MTCRGPFRAWRKVGSQATQRWRIFTRFVGINPDPCQPEETLP